MGATDVHVYYRDLGNKGPHIGMTLSNQKSRLDVRVLSYADNGLVLERIGGYTQNSSWLGVRDIIGLMVGCFEAGSNFGIEMAKFYGKGYQYVKAITMNIYGTHITANRYGYGLKELWNQWILQSNRRFLANNVE